MILAAPEVEVLFRQNGYRPDVVLLSGDFETVTRNWVQSKYGPALQNEMSAWQRENGKNNRCKAYTRFAVNFAQVLHERMTPDGATALAFGGLWYRRVVGAGHSLCWFISFETEGPRINIYEEETLEITTLTEEEKLLCEAVWCS